MSENNTTSGIDGTLNGYITILDAMQRQCPTDDGWVCPKCIYWKGDLNCDKNVFISAVGCNMSGCQCRRER